MFVCSPTPLSQLESSRAGCTSQPPTSCSTCSRWTTLWTPLPCMASAVCGASSPPHSSPTRCPPLPLTVTLSQRRAMVRTLHPPSPPFRSLICLQSKYPTCKWTKNFELLGLKFSGIYRENSWCAGLFLGGGWRLLGAAVVLILAISAWVLGHMLPFFYALKFLNLLRASDDDQTEGLDASHGMGVDSTWYSSRTAMFEKRHAFLSCL